MAVVDTAKKVFGTPKWWVLKQQRLRYLKKRFPNGKISAHFTYREFFCRDGMPFPIKATDHLVWYVRNILEPMRGKFGVVRISGPYRHYYYNRDVVKGASDSRHVWDKHPDEIANDLTCARGNPSEWAAWLSDRLRTLGRGGGVGVYTASWFTHCDTRRSPARWTGN